jgi:thioredoxin 1
MLSNHKRKLVIVMFLFVVFAGVLIVASANAQGNTKTPPPIKQIPRLVDVGAKECVPCKMMMPVIDALKSEYAGTLVVDFIDVWENPKAGEKYGVRGIPTQIFYDASGKELGRHLGYISKEDILNTFKKMGIELKKPTAQSKK